jgi:hypothetical protein
MTIAQTSGNTALTFQQTNNGTTNFLIGCQYNVGNAFEITPSTAAGGSTFNTPALVVDSSGKVAVSGQLDTSSGASKVMRTSQRTAISGTTNTTIVTTIGASGGSSASAAQVIVYGSNNGANAFMDTLNCMGSQAVVVAQSSTLDGSPHSRTYSISGLNLNVQLSSGASGYAVNCCVTTLQFPF